MGGKDDGNGAANESNSLLQQQINLEKEQEKQKLVALQKEEFDIVSDQTGGNFKGKKPTQSDYGPTPPKLPWPWG